MTPETTTILRKLLYDDDDDDDTGSGFLTTLISSISTSNISTMLPILENITGVIDYNISSAQDPAHNLTTVKGADVQLKLYDIVITVFGGIVLIMNLSVVISSGLILKGGAQPRGTYLFLGNVAMADLIISVAVLFGQYFPRDKRNELICIFQMGFIVSSTLVSIWSVLLIGIDRFFYIVHALTYQHKLTTYVVRWLIFFVWILGLIIGFMPITGWKGDTENGRYCWFIKLAPGELIITTAIIGCLPIFIITVLYSIILYHALKKVRHIQKADFEASTKQIPKDSNNPNQLRIFRGGQNTNANKKQNSPKKFRAIMIVALTTGSFIITWVPYLIASAIYVHCRKTAKDPEDCKALSLIIASPLAILGFMNSLLNPLIYAWWHKGFRTFVCTKVLRRKRVPGRGTGSSNTQKSSTKTISSATGSSQNSRPTSRKISVAVTEGPYVGENEDTRL